MLSGSQLARGWSSFLICGFCAPLSVLKRNHQAKERNYSGQSKDWRSSFDCRRRTKSPQLYNGRKVSSRPHKSTGQVIKTDLWNCFHQFLVVQQNRCCTFKKFLLLLYLIKKQTLTRKHNLQPMSVTNELYWQCKPFLKVYFTQNYNLVFASFYVNRGTQCFGTMPIFDMRF